MIFTLLVIFVTVAFIVITLTAVVNALMFPRLYVSAVRSRTRVSVLIPARNEANVIAETVRGILAQTYTNLEVIVLDDASDDGTAEAALAAGEGDARLQVIAGKPLPSSWWGKNWACHQLAQVATGDWRIFTDADVQWKPEALSAVVDEIERTNADLLSVWPTQHSETWSERLVVPLMALAIIGYLPLIGVHFTRWRMFAAANGQCMAFRRECYAAVGGHEAVRDQILEDVLLARRVKALGLTLRMVDGAGLINCRMYSGWASVRDGFAKNILAGYGDSVIALLLATVFHWLLFIFPALWLAFGWSRNAIGWPLWPALLVGLGIGVRALTAAVTRQRVLDAVYMPLSVLLMTWIAGQALWWRWRYGGPRWKGRSLSPQEVVTAQRVKHG
ncbi:MAG: glycosyltransferase [Burkholderiales bacterium]|nr:glycosyltransferase [Anaerolineae bacterium]